MAAKPTAREVLVLQIDEIRVPDQRFRALKVDQARAIGAAIAADGQYEPIAVTRLPGRSDYELVDGWHRLEGSRMAGLLTIEACQIGNEAGLRIRREAISGFARATHDVFDRAAAIVAMMNLAREEAGLPTGDLRVLNGSTRSLKDIGDAAETDLIFTIKSLRWDEQVAEQLGLSAGAVRRLKAIHERVPDSAKGRLRVLGQANSISLLLKFSALLSDEMERVLTVLGEQDPPDLSDALSRLTPAPPTAPPEKAQNAFFRKAGGWSPRERASFWEQWNSSYWPDGRKRDAKAERSDA